MSLTMVSDGVASDHLSANAKEALRRGDIYFFNGRPCKKGHVSKRYAKSGNCVDCAAERTEWRVKSGNAAEVQQRYRDRDPERNRAHAKAFHFRHREKCLAVMRKNYLANVEERRRVARIQSKRWAKENPDKVRAQKAVRRARKVSAPGKHTSQDIANLMVAQDGRCAVCDVSLVPKYHVDHIVPLSRGGTNWPSNLQLLCPTCNCSKGDKDFDLWLRERAWPASRITEVSTGGNCAETPSNALAIGARCPDVALESV